MEYEIVTLKEKTVVGISARTSNSSSDMGAVIGGLWERFFGTVYNEIPNNRSGKALGIYTDYAGDETAEYSIITACEVEPGKERQTQPEGTIIRTIPEGNYAKFVVKGNLHQAIAEFWQKLWGMELPRTFVCDFEEYQNGDAENSEIHVYIGVKG